jgi:urea carboxylase
MACLDDCDKSLTDLDDLIIPTRTVHLPLSWEDPATLLAIEKYMRSVRADAPWCPSNIEFIRRINGLDRVEDVRKIVFDAATWSWASATCISVHRWQHRSIRGTGW